MCTPALRPVRRLLANGITVARVAFGGLNRQRPFVPVTYLLEILALVGTAFIVWFVLVAFFTPRIDYRISAPPRLDSDEFLRVVQATCQAAVIGSNRVEILTNGSRFYRAMLDAIGAAQVSVNLESYIFVPGQIADRVIDVLVARADAPRACAGRCQVLAFGHPRIPHLMERPQNRIKIPLA